MDKAKREFERELQKDFDNPGLHRIYADILERGGQVDSIYYWKARVQFYMWEYHHNIDSQALTKLTAIRGLLAKLWPFIEKKSESYYPDFFIDLTESEVRWRQEYSEIKELPETDTPACEYKIKKLVVLLRHEGRGADWENRWGDAHFYLKKVELKI